MWSDTIEAYTSEFINQYIRDLQTYRRELKKIQEYNPIINIKMLFMIYKEDRE